MPADTKALSVKSLFNEMILADKCDDDTYSWLILTCKSQSLLSSISRRSIGVEEMTLNTFKKYADNEIDGGFSSVNALRKKLYKKNNPKLNRKAKKDRQRDRQTNLKVKLEEAERYRAIILRAYNDLNKITIDAIKTNPKYEYDYLKHEELYSEYFGLKMVVNNG